MPPIVTEERSSLPDTNVHHNLARTLGTRSVAPHTAVFLGITAVVLTVIVTTGLFAFYLYWRQKRERLEKLQRKAIRHMTLVGPVGSPYGPFGATGESSFFRPSYDNNSVRPSIEQNVPASPAPTYSPHRDRILPRSATNSDESLTSSVATKRTYSEGERMVLVNGVYVVALNSDSVRE